MNIYYNKFFSLFAQMGLLRYLRGGISKYSLKTSPTTDGDLTKISA